MGLKKAHHGDDARIAQNVHISSYQDAIKLGERKGEAGFLGGLTKDLALNSEIAPAKGFLREEASEGAGAIPDLKLAPVFLWMQRW